MAKALNGLLRLPRYYLLRIRRLKGDPQYLALGVGLGVFMGNLPLVPQTILLIPLTIALQASTLAAVVASVLVNNPLTVMAQYYLAWLAGNAILPGHCSWEQLQAALQVVSEQGLIGGIAALGALGMETLVVLLVGGAAIGLPASVASYCLALKFFRRIRERRSRKHRLDNQ